MLRLHSKDVLTLVVICYVAVTVIGLRFKPRKINEQSTSQMELIGQPAFNTSQSLKSNTSSWTHEESAVVVDNLPTKRQTQSADVDNPEESLFDIFHDKPIKEEFITNKDNAGPAYRRVIIIPNTVDALRIPHPYPFHPVRLLDPVIDPVRFIPSPLHIHHYRRVPVPVEVPKYQHIPQPYYVPYKPKPDYTVTDVQVYDPGEYKKWFILTSTINLEYRLMSMQYFIVTRCFSFNVLSAYCALRIKELKRRLSSSLITSTTKRERNKPRCK